MLNYLSLLTNNRSGIIQWDIEKDALKINISNANQCMTFEFEEQIIFDINLEKEERNKTRPNENYNKIDISIKSMYNLIF